MSEAKLYVHCARRIYNHINSFRKRKQLKVAQIKEILTKAGVAFKNNEVKGDLIAKVLANPAALKIATGKDEKPAETSKGNDEDLVSPVERIFSRFGLILLISLHLLKSMCLLILIFYQRN
jgi:hypothetical protein